MVPYAISNIAIPYLTTSRLVRHFLFWLCVITGYVLVQPLLITGYGWGIYFLMLSVKFLSIICMVYTNLYLLIPATILKQKKLSLYLLLLLCLNLCISLLLVGIDNAFFAYRHQSGAETPKQAERVYYFTTQFISNCWYLGITTSLKFAWLYFRRRTEVSTIEIAKLQTEVKYLVAQVNPHFLFNAINTIYVQIDRKNEAARDTVDRFSNMLRYQLYECNAETVSLEKELQYVRNYVDIQRLRKSQRHRIELDYPIISGDIQIPPMLFIGFLENAFKYVSNDRGRDNYVHIRFKVEGNMLTFHCENTVYKNVLAGESNTGGGIGLKNIRRRLELQFKDRYILVITNSTERFTIHLILTLQ